jgi:23S rRNA pseudouridine1911/1915/1917 synthase
MEKLIPEVLFKDDDILVVSKPAGMIVNNADTSRKVYTLQDWVQENFKPKVGSSKSEAQTEFEKRGGIAHRLDKETSGVLIIARNEESFTNLQAQFKEHRIDKTYTALCHGKLVSEGEINVPIGRLPWNRMRFGVLPQGREAYTKFKVIKFLSLKTGRSVEALSLVEVYPKSGRTHQIRVHFQYVGFPIFADALYAGRKIFDNDKKYLNRHFLHASKITFSHPKSNEKMIIEAPLSPELVDFLSKLT